MFFNKVESKVVKNTTQKKDEFCNQDVLSTYLSGALLSFYLLQLLESVFKF